MATALTGGAFPAALRAIINARVLPMTRPQAEARAIAWHRDEILAVGRNEEVEALAASRGVEAEDAQGRIIIPGFVDAHMHFLHVGLKRIRPDLRGAGSKEEALARLRGWIRTNPGTEAVTAEGWDESEWDRSDRASEDGDEATPFHRAELDEVAGDRPLVVRRICGHVAFANSAALPFITARWGAATEHVAPLGKGGQPPVEEATSQRLVEDVTSQRPVKDVTRQPLVDEETGRLIEAPSLYLNEVLPATDKQLDAAVQRACLVAHQLGVTTVAAYEQAPLRAALQRAAQAGRLGVRIVCNIYMQHLEEALAEGFRTGRQLAPMMHDGGLKVFLDGSLGGHTARMLEPYEDHPGRGLANHTDKELDDVLARALGAGVQVHAHAIGDGAVEQALQAYERLAARGGGHETAARVHDATAGHGGDETAGLGGEAAGRGVGAGTGKRPQPLGVDVDGDWVAHRFEHFEIVHDGQIQRAAALGLWASSQPNFVGEWSAKGGMYETRIGKRYRLNNRFRSYLDGGVRLAFGSDGMPFGPLFGIASAMEHPEPAQRLDARQAVWHYTHEAAASLGRNDVGSLAPGKKADLLILARKDLEAPATGWIIAETIVAGQTVQQGTQPAPTDDDVKT